LAKIKQLIYVTAKINFSLIENEYRIFNFNFRKNPKHIDKPY